MAGTITHEWNGTVLTVTSDSGTSSADLQGKQGKQGIRGPQGRAGVILSEDGSVDMTGYATEAYVLDAIDTALEDYTPSGGGGGGGGGSDNDAKLTVKSTTGWTFKTLAGDTACLLSGTWSSIEEDAPTGSGTLTLSINNIIKMSRSVPQGNFSINVTPYLNTGSNTIKIKITDIYGNNKSIAFTVNKLNLTITSTFDGTVPYDSSIPFTYTPMGNATKTVHFILDGSELGTQEVTTSGRQQTYVIPKQSHGSHSLEVYYTVDIDGEPVPSNKLYYDLICITEGTTVPIISCPYKAGDITQFETVNIPYIVYNPVSLNATITLEANGMFVSELTVDRTQQIWAYRIDNAGVNTLTITCGIITKTITIDAEESPIDVTPSTENLELHLSSYGRSNNSANRNVWEYGDIKCRFSNYNWITDGWQLDKDGITVHRLTGDARLTIPLKMFETDFRTTGKTIEFEFATSDVRDYDTEVVSCYSGGIGFKMTAQKALLKSEQSEIYTQYKEDEHIRISFVVEKKAENRLIFIYLNGIMCGAVQYPEDDNFSQGSPVNITIGSNECTLDLYNIRVYNNSLNRYQIIDNWIADTQDIVLKSNRYARNRIYDAYGNVVIENLPSNLPYMILTGATLPQYKGNVLSVDGEFVNTTNPDKSFSFAGGEIDVQGTTSAEYTRKNYKLKFLNGLNQNGSFKDDYKMRNDSIATDCFCFKADVASSEGANNVELVRLYNSACPYKTPPQKANASVRQGIDGFPMVIFHNNGETTEFIGKYNFNNEKSTHEVYGLTTGDESWEIRNNTSDRVIWKNDDFSGTDWQNDFEARYPKNNTNTTNLARFSSWVKSTDRTTATNRTLPTSVMYDGVEYTIDNAEYRLAKFRAEASTYIELDSALFYYLFTELFLMVDSRAKNAFPSLVGTNKIVWLPYDMDTACGINNEGALVFGYELEDIDTTSTGADVYNGQHSVFWCNIRDCFKDELQTMYKNLRSNNKISYQIIEDAYEEHQAVWPEAIWNEDAYYKYLEPLINDGSGIYLPMLQGSKAEQRKWWLYNRFRYIDSKYNAGDALTDVITLRGYDKSDITVTPYADIYATVKYGSYLVQERALRGGKYLLECPLDNVNDTEIYIYSASQLKDIGDVSGFNVGLADFSKATRLQSVKVGDGSSDYSNTNLTSLTLGNNILLKKIDARNCINLGTGEQQSLNLSGCSNIEEVYLTGTALKGVTLPNGGVLKTLHLPDTIANLTICNQPSLKNVVLNNYSNITTLRLENVGGFESDLIVRNMQSGGRVRLIDVNWDLDNSNICLATMNKLATMKGLNEQGNNVDSVQISGRILVSGMCNSYVPQWRELYPNVEFIVSDISLNGCSWEEINRFCMNGTASSIFNVGDEKEIELTDGEKITLVIYGFNHDDLADGTGKSSITFGTKNAIETTDLMYDGNLAYTSWWQKSQMRTSRLPFILNKFPDDLKALVKEVSKTTGNGSKYNFDTAHTGVETLTEKLFLLSAVEVMGIRHQKYPSDDYPYALDKEGTQYDYFKDAPIPVGASFVPVEDGATKGTFYNNSTEWNTYVNRFGTEVDVYGNYYANYNAVKGAGDDATTAASYWWLRSPTINTYNTSSSNAAGKRYFFAITPSGVLYPRYMSDSYSISFAFCI